MALEVDLFNDIVLLGGKLHFRVTGGVGPYVASVDKGSIEIIQNNADLLTANFLAPRELGNYELLVSDTNGDEAIGIFGVVDVLSSICAIINEGVKLPDGAVRVSNQRYFLDNNDGMQVIVAGGSSRLYATYRKGGVVVQEFLDNISVDVFSANEEARLRKHEVLAALNSSYSVRVQRVNNLSITNLSEIQNISEVQGTARINRFNFTFFVYNEKVTSDGSAGVIDAPNDLNITGDL